MVQVAAGSSGVCLARGPEKLRTTRRSRKPGQRCSRRCCSHDCSESCSNAHAGSAACSTARDGSGRSHCRNRKPARSRKWGRRRRSASGRHRSERHRSGRRNRTTAGSRDSDGSNARGSSAHGSSADGHSRCRNRTSGPHRNRRRLRSHSHRRSRRRRRTFRTAQTPELDPRYTAYPLPTRQPQYDSSWGGSSKDRELGGRRKRKLACRRNRRPRFARGICGSRNSDWQRPFSMHNAESGVAIVAVSGRASLPGRVAGDFSRLPGRMRRRCRS